jgi:cell division protein FtsI (penicillin-binding protein 3)
VVIDEPQGADQYGGDVSAPVFKAIAEALYARYIDVQSQKIIKRETTLFQTNLPTNEVSKYEDVQTILQELKISSVKPEDGSDWVSPSPQRMAVTWKAHKIEPNKIPNVKGLSLRDAIYILENRGLKVFYSGYGRVKTQSLMPGSALTVGSKIVIQLE